MRMLTARLRAAAQPSQPFAADTRLADMAEFPLDKLISTQMGFCE